MPFLSPPPPTQRSRVGEYCVDGADRCPEKMRRMERGDGDGFLVQGLLLLQIPFSPSSSVEMNVRQGIYCFGGRGGVNWGGTGIERHPYDPIKDLPAYLTLSTPSTPPKPAMNPREIEEQKKVISKLKIACVLCVSFMIVEVIGGLMAKSLAVLSDAAHLMTDLSR